MADWYLKFEDGSETGPISEADFKELIRTEIVKPDTKVRTSVSKPWATADKVKGIRFTNNSPSIETQIPAITPVNSTVVSIPSMRRFPKWGIFALCGGVVFLSLFVGVVFIVQRGSALSEKRAAAEREKNEQARHNELMNSMDEQLMQSKLAELQSLKNEMEANSKTAQEELELLEKYRREGNVEGMRQISKRVQERAKRNELFQK